MAIGGTVAHVTPFIETGTPPDAANAWDGTAAHTLSLTGFGTAATSAIGDFDAAGSAAAAQAAAIAASESRLAYAALTIDTADVVGVVNTLHFATIAGLTANRNWVLPAVHAVDDRCALFIADGDASFAVPVKAAAGDTIIGPGGSFAAVEWSRFFIIGEFVVLRSVVANTTWVVEIDGRIPQVGSMWLTTAATGNAALTFVRPTAFTTVAGVWTVKRDNASICSTTADSMTLRRANDYQFEFQCVMGNQTIVSDAFYSGGALFLNGSVFLASTNVSAGPGATSIIGPNSNNASVYPFAAGDVLVFQARSEQADRGCQASSTRPISAFSVHEIL